MERFVLDFLRVTRAAAVAAAPWIGRGRKHEADEAATSAMRRVLSTVPMNGTVVIGEGELDEAPMLYIGEKVGTGTGERLDIAVDPLEGTNLVAYGQDNAAAVIAAAPSGSLLHAPDMYMEKLAAGPGAKGVLDLTRPFMDNMERVAAALGKPMAEMTVMVQQRDRHQPIIERIRQTGARVRLFGDGDIMCAIATAVEGAGVDLFYGVGGAPEGVLTAVALKCLGGDMQARLLPANEAEHARCVAMGLADPSRCLAMNDLISADDCLFAATGITSGLLLDGVRSKPGGGDRTHSMVACGPTGSLHFIDTMHSQMLVS
ncbi:fructose-1,6-bisphosphatase [Paenibacillus sp. J31TS4]|uniref:class II fructose-bisphosphatase n=1 Tax=Paenibacillus sp. J31TS4 TaxID=2807195 RepID=UPI001B13C1B5|nr:class II fructose-bisphosphatase [Paenibacillus sp. J31TS4]GIP41390.1 fructose-1,6-bisphosphatase [Paenibacillus sp. J31TS4]